MNFAAMNNHFSSTKSPLTFLLSHCRCCPRTAAGIGTIGCRIQQNALSSCCCGSFVSCCCRTNGTPTLAACRLRLAAKVSLFLRSCYRSRDRGPGQGQNRERLDSTIAAADCLSLAVETELHSPSCNRRAPLGKEEESVAWRRSLAGNPAGRKRTVLSIYPTSFPSYSLLGGGTGPGGGGLGYGFGGGAGEEAGGVGSGLGGGGDFDGGGGGSSGFGGGYGSGAGGGFGGELP